MAQWFTVMTPEAELAPGCLGHGPCAASYRVYQHLIPLAQLPRCTKNNIEQSLEFTPLSINLELTIKLHVP